MKKVEITRRRFLRGLKKLLKENDVWLCIGERSRVVAVIPGAKFLVGVGVVDSNNIDGEMLEVTND